MTLPEELKNKVVWAAFVAELAKEQGDSEWLNAGVVASFLEKKRKELNLIYADSMFEVGEIKGFADGLYAQDLISKPKYAAVLETVLNLTKKMKIMLAVFGGEEK